MTPFTPVSALLGGLLIGLAAVLLLALNGRIAGVSGIAAGLLARPDGAGRAWRLLFLLGLAGGGWLYAALGGPVPAPRASPGAGWLIVAGLVVGFGTSMAGGCTSGHGVCGLARLSLRSLVAVLVFLGCGFATVFVVRHVAGLA